MKIRKVDVTPGVKWVEIEDVDLRILCGCPADIVKHLMRRGLIVPTEVDGVACETGPNAILLSDVTLQGSAFSNLAEFPVLQMLYRQGLLLPDHPNNTGRKPMIIGLPEQIDCQLNYIHRGNYGLVSKQELMETGLSEEEAEEHFAIKLHFAFGAIHPPNELLDTVPLGDDAVEIREGVTIRRQRLNGYRIEYDGESVDVDMNLREVQRYASPFPLGMHKVSREFFAVIHSGEGDGWDIDRPCMGSILSYQGALYLIDAGPNLEAILHALSLSVNEIAGVFHTHSHDDHFAGLTTLLQANRKMKYFATPYVRAAVCKKFSALVGIGEQEFDQFFDVVDLKAAEWNDIDGLEVMPQYSPHPVETTTFQFRALGPDGYQYYAHLADVASDRVLDEMVANGKAGRPISAEKILSVKNNYRAFANLKKIDIGGGLIHGEAEDFADDPSSKLVLAHVARPLEAYEKQIGSGAEFGVVDKLIPSTQDYLRRIAYAQLVSYFPTQPPAQLQLLLNNEVREYNPHEIIQREGKNVGELRLILSGNAEVLTSSSRDSMNFRAGALLGELPLLRGEVSGETHRATSYLQALIIPGGQYLDFLDLYGDRLASERIAERRDWLRSTWLCGDGAGYEVQNKIIEAAEVLSIDDGEVIEDEENKDYLRLIQSGIIKRFYGEYVIETLRGGDFFNEGRAIFGVTPKTSWRSIGETLVWDIPKDVIANTPIIRFKILETFRRRVQMVRDTEGATANE